jgi:hypothetical protein
MARTKGEPTKIEYPKHWFVILAILLWLVDLLAFCSAYVAEESDWRTSWLIITPLVAALIFLFFVPPMFTHHLVGDRGLLIRMGLLINLTVPYEWIVEVKETYVHRGGLRIGVGVRYFPISKALFVTSSFSTLVKIRLDGEHAIGGVRKKRVEEIVLSVKSVNLFLDALTERALGQKGV